MSRAVILLVTALVAVHETRADSASDIYEEKQITYSGGSYKDEVFRYRLLSPERIESGKTYPLILFLHGAGERGDDNALQLLYLPELMAKPEYRRRFPCFLLAPQCRRDHQWVDVPWGDSKSTPMADEPTHQLRVAMRALDKTIKECPVDRARIYLTGLSMGGYGSWELAARKPGLFAAVVPICGGADESQAPRIAHIPIWTTHGDADRAVPVVRSRRMIEALRKAGGKPKYVEYPGVGHNAWTPTYSDPDGAVPWMFRQRRAAADQ